MNHVDATLLAVYADGRTTAEERTLIETHLADCTSCRMQVAAARGMAQSLEPRIGRWAGWGIAAAVVLLVMYSSHRRSQLLDETHIERGHPETEQPSHIATTSPGPGALASTDSVVFVWHARPEVISYRLTVLAEEGTAVWSVVTSDTSARLPAVHTLTPGAQYFWIVDGLLRDGKSATSGSIKFTTRSP